MVPEGWGRFSVGDVFEVQLGKMLNQIAKDGEEQRDYLTNINVRWGQFDLSSLNRMHFNAKERGKFRLKAGDLIVCEGGEVGRCAIWKDALVECYYQKALHRLRPKEGENGNAKVNHGSGEIVLLRAE
jgi:type I restriction enzyme S subunit